MTSRRPLLALATLCLAALAPSLRAQVPLAVWNDWQGGAAWLDEGGLLILADSGEGVLETSGGSLAGEGADGGLHSDFDELSLSLLSESPVPAAGRLALTLRGAGENRSFISDTIRLVSPGGPGRAPFAIRHSGNAVTYFWNSDSADHPGEWKLVWRMPAHATLAEIELAAGD